MKKASLFLMIGFVTLISMISFADQNIHDKKLPILTDQNLEQSIQNSIDEELDSGTYAEFKDIQIFSNDIEGQSETNNSVDQSKDNTFDDPNVNLEKITTLTVHEIQHPFNYDFKSVPVTQMVDEAKIRYESIYLDKSSGEKFIIQTRFNGDELSSGFRSYTNKEMYEILINPDYLSEYLSANGIETYDNVKLLTYRSLRFSALLVQTDEDYKLLPFKINLENFKYADAKVVDAQEYFVTLNEYYEKILEERKNGDGEKRLGGSILTNHNPILYITTIVVILLVVGLTIIKKNKPSFFKH